MTISEVSIQKYLDGIVSINSTLGRLDVLRIHLKENGDMHSIHVIDAIIRELSNVCGVTYRSINIDSVQKVAPKPLLLLGENMKNAESDFKAVKNENRYKYMSEDKDGSKNGTFSQEQKKPCDIAQAVLKAESVQKNNNDNITYYDFKNSNTLNYMKYDKISKDLIIQFKQNLRTYKYKKVPKYMIDNLYLIDERNASAGSYLQQNVIKKWKKSMYEEITDTTLIG